jgi:hypothetical protein
MGSYFNSYFGASKLLYKNTKPLIDKGYVKKEIKLSKTGKECLSQLATTLPSSELKSTIQSFLQKHRDD